MRASRWCGAALMWLTLSLPALGLDPRLSLRQYLHKSWTQTDAGQIPFVNALTQTPDGYLWLGTSRGILRFDGVKFGSPSIPAHTADEAIRAVAADSRGGLWIGTLRGLTLWNYQNVSPPAAALETPSDFLSALLEDHAGRLWSSGKLSGRPIFLAADTRNPGSRMLRGAGIPSEVVSVTEDRDGIIWLVAAGKIYSCSVMGREYGCTPAAALQPGWDVHKPLIKTVLHDRDGNLWIGTFGQGFFRVSGGTAQRFTERDGLSSDVVASLFEDREGIIWVGTSNGLDRFREPKVARWTDLDGLSGNLVSAVLATRDGNVWVGTLGGGLDRIGRKGISHFGSLLPDRPRADVISLFEDARGRLWVGTSRGVGVLDGTAFRPIPSEGPETWRHVFAFAQDGDGAVWLVDSGPGLGVVHDGRIAPAHLAGADSHNVHQLATDRHGNLWIGYADGSVVVVQQGGARRFTASDGLPTGLVQALFDDTSGNMWVGTINGMSRLRQGHWTRWTVRNGMPPGGVEAFAEDQRKTLWLLTRAGLAPFPGPTNTDKPAMPFYGPNDGIRMPEVGAENNPHMTVSADGRVWLATPDGLAALDPKRMNALPAPPPVAIDQLVNDGRAQAAGRAGLHLRGRSLEIDYTALSLALPEALRFRYRLDPLDSHWVDAATRRDIAYAELRPGHYRFEVTARGEDSAWNPAPATVDFTVDPRFYQTWAFWAMCACTIGLLSYAAHKWRIRLLRARFQIVLRERSRLTRDLHDTLLQGFAGVVFQLEAATRQMETQPDASRTRIRRALEQSDQALREARQALSSLRMPELENNTLPEALKRAAESIVGGTSSRFHMEIKGRPYELPYDVQANLFIIAREAINNAVAHAKADRISITVSYGAEDVKLTMKDDGRGFDLAQPRRSDHWGLAGMQERARHIHGNLVIRSALGEGTEVEIVIGRQTRKRAAAD